MAKEVRVLLNLFVESKELENVTQSLVKLPEVTDVYEVTGEYDIVCMLKVESILAFRNILKDKVLKINGVRSTVSSVVLRTQTRRKTGLRVIDPGPRTARLSGKEKLISYLE